MDAHKNFAYSLIAIAPSPAASGTSLTVAAGQGSLFPATPFNATVWATGAIPITTNAEIVRVTLIVGDVLTIVRAQEGTSARTILVGDQIAATVTVKTFTDIETAFAGTNGAITGGSLTLNSSGLSISLPPYLTTAMLSNAATLSNVKVSAGASSDFLSALTFSNSNGLAFGLNAGTITGSYTVPTVTAGSDTAGMSNLGNTSGTSGVVSGDAIRLLLAGGNNITLSQSINGASATITISGANVGGAQTGISGLAASNTTYTSGSVTITGVGGGVTVSSNTGQRIDISVAAPVAQTVQTQNVHNLSLSGNTSGVLAQISSGTAILAGGNNITLSQNGQSITISGANAGGAQTAISGLIVSDATYSSGTVSFSNAGNITISSSVNGATQYIKLSGNAAQTTQSAIKAFGVSNTGQTAGNTGVSSGIDWVMAGSGSITLSQSTAGGGPNTVWVQHPAWLTTAALSQDSSKYAGTNGAITGGSITVNTSGVSVNLPAYISTQSTQFLALTLGGNSAGTSTFHATNNASLFFNGGNNITLSGNGSTVTIVGAAQTVQSAIKGFGASNTGNTAGNTGLSTGIDWVLAGSNNITISQSTAGGGPNTLWVSGPTVGGAQTGISGIIVSDATYTSGTVSFSNAGNITIASSVNGATQYIKLSGNAAQTNQSAIEGFGVSNTGQTAGNTGISTGIDWVLAGSGSITLSQSTAAGTNTIWFQHPAWITTAPGIATTVNPVASANSTGTITRYAPEDHRHAGIGAVGISTSGNTAGTTGSLQGTYWFQGGSNITLSQITSNNGSHTLVISGASAAPSPINFSASTTSNNLGSVVFSNSNGVSFGLAGSTITGTVSTFDTVGSATTVSPVASANSLGTITRWAAEDHQHAGIGGLGISTAGNSTGTTGSLVGTYWFQGGNNITLSQITSNNGSHTLIVSGAGAPASYFRNAAAELLNGTTTLSLSGSTSYIQPLVIPYDLSVSYVRMLHSFAVTNTTSIATTANATGNCSMGSTFWCMVYTNKTGASSQSLGSYASASAPVIQAWHLSANANGSQWTLSQSITHPITGGTSQFTTGVTTSLTNYSLGSLSLTRFTGLQHVDIPLATLLTEGNYWLMFGVSSSSAAQGSGTAFSQLRLSNSLIGATQINVAIPYMGQVTNASVQLQVGIGSFSTNAIGTTASLGFSNISSSASYPLLPIQLLRVT